MARSDSEPKQQRASGEYVEQIAIALMQYAADNDGVFPESVETMRDRLRGPLQTAEVMRAPHQRPGGRCVLLCSGLRHERPGQHDHPLRGSEDLSGRRDPSDPRRRDCPLVLQPPHASLSQGNRAARRHAVCAASQRLDRVSVRRCPLQSAHERHTLHQDHPRRHPLPSPVRRRTHVCLPRHQPAFGGSHARDPQRTSPDTRRPLRRLRRRRSASHSPRVARAILKATGTTDYNVLQNNGAAAHQAVFHVHFHIIPKHPDGTGLGITWNTHDLTNADDLTNAIRNAL